MEHIDTDFCIVGGGPAGLSLALMLVRSGARVVVVEKAAAFDRDYRGEVLQPGAMRLLAELGVLDDIRARAGYELSRFLLIDKGRTIMEIDYRVLPPPYSFLFSVPQRVILEQLYAACRRYEQFRHIFGRSAQQLVTEEGRVAGVRCGRGDEETIVRAHCVVGADGRYSRIRRLAGIDYERDEAFEHDVLWFRLPATGRPSHDIRVFRDSGNAVLSHDSYPDRLQVGWTLPHGGYRDLAGRDIAEIKQEIARAVPPYADLVREHVRERTDLTLLDVFAGIARGWTRDGLLLIGDSAHTHGPIGAQGINLAIQDAAVAHPALMRSLRTRDVSRVALGEVEARRRPAVQRVTAMQAKQARAMLSSGWLVDRARPVVARALARTPVYRRVLDQIAFGDHTVRVHSDLFVERPISSGPVSSGPVNSGPVSAGPVNPEGGTSP